VTLIYPSSTFYEYTGDSILVNGLYGLLSSPVLQSIFAIVLVFIQTTLINNISIVNRLSNEASLFAGIVYIVITSLTTALLGLSPILFANLLLLFAILNVFNTYKNTNAVGNIFGTGFFVSVSAIFYPPFIIFVLWGFIALIILHSFKWREKLQYFSGVGTAIYLLYGIVFYFNNGIGKAMSSFYSQVGFFRFKTMDLESWLVVVTYALLFILAFFSYNRYGQKKRVEVQKKIDILFWYMAFCIPAILISKNVTLTSILIIAPALSMLLGINMSQSRSKLTLELIHVAFLGIMVYSHYFL
jgi:hypothetical protein